MLVSSPRQPPAANDWLTWDQKSQLLYSKGNQLCALELPGRSGWSWSPPKMTSFFNFLLSTLLSCFLLSLSPESHLSKSLAQESPSEGQDGFPRNKDRYSGSQLLSIRFGFGVFPILACWVIYFLYNNPSLLELAWGLFFLSSKTSPNCVNLVKFLNHSQFHSIRKMVPMILMTSVLALVI